MVITIYGNVEACKRSLVKQTMFGCVEILSIQEKIEKRQLGRSLEVGGRGLVEIINCVCLCARECTCVTWYVSL